jgi:hypothetical protein
MKRDLKVGDNRDDEKTNGLPRGLSRPMDQPPGTRWELGLQDS